MQSRAIPDSSIAASSYYRSDHAPQQGRLHYRASGRSGSWCAKRNRAGEWLQVDLGKISTIKGVATQGRYDYNQWVKTYTLQYSNNGKTFKKYQGGKVFKGNSDRHTVVKHNLNPPIYARRGLCECHVMDGLCECHVVDVLCECHVVDGVCACHVVDGLCVYHVVDGMC
ncbi:Contactin-associated protein-like 5 [Exaiptasia diaphana]|nr:Contactin-associated protein-like 5 [Exaiptasia diaphana]